MLKKLFTKESRNSLYSYVFLLPVTLTLPLNISLVIKSLSIVLFFCYLLFINKKSLSFNLSTYFILCSSLFFLDPILSFVRDGIIFLSDTRLGFAVIPLSFILTNAKHEQYYDQITIGLIIGNLTYALAVLYCFFFLESYDIGYFSFKEWYFNSNIYIHHTYSGLFILISIIQVYFSALKSKVVLLISLFLALILVGSKFSFGIALLFLATMMIKKRRGFIWLGLASFLCAIFYYVLYTFDDALYWSSFTRLKIWKRVFSILDGEIILEGVNQVDDMAYLIGVGKYSVKERLMNYDAHNIFLQELLSNGLIGLSALVVLFVFFFKRLLNDKEGLFIFLTFLSFGCIENLFELQIGVTSFMFFVSIFFWKNKFPEKQIT